MSADIVDLGEVRRERDRGCRCAGDGVTVVDCSPCPVHAGDPESSPLMRQLNETWERHCEAARRAADGQDLEGK